MPAVRASPTRVQYSHNNNNNSVSIQNAIHKPIDPALRLPITNYDETYTVIFENEEWVIPRRYQLVKLLGEGAYGAVASATDRETGRMVAIKKNRNIFPSYLNTTNYEKVKKTKSGKQVPQHRSCISQLRILREAKILKHIGQQHPNIIRLHGLLVPESFDKFSDVYLVTDMMEADLRDVLDSTMALENAHVQFLMFQLLQAIAFIHDCDILHRDIKPENILVNSDCSLRLCDFGLARGCDFEIKDEEEGASTRLSTNYVQTRQYRAPELLLNADRIGKATDMWSVGCIMAEMLNHGKVLFDGTSTQDQIWQIIKVLGTPPLDAIKGSAPAREFLKQLAYVTPNEEWFLDHIQRNNKDPNALHLLSMLLQWDPKKRITAREALMHPYFFVLRNRLTKCTPTKFDFSFEKKLVVDNRDDTISYGALVKRECYDTILEFNGIEEVIETTIVEEMDAKKKQSLLRLVKNIFRRKIT
jgi:serine/threonine protein kinase